MHDIKAERLKRFMSQKRLAYEAGISARTLRKAEGGESISPETYRSICRVLNLDPNHIESERLAFDKVERIISRRSTVGWPIKLALLLSISAAIDVFSPGLLSFFLMVSVSLAVASVVIWDAPGRRVTSGKIGGVVLILTAGTIYFYRSYDGEVLEKTILLLAGMGGVFLLPDVAHRIFPFSGDMEKAMRRLVFILFLAYLWVYWTANRYYTVAGLEYAYSSLKSLRQPIWWTLISYPITVALMSVGSAMVFAANGKRQRAGVLFVVVSVAVDCFILVYDAVSFDASSMLHLAFYQSVKFALIAAALFFVRGDIDQLTNRIIKRMSTFWRLSRFRKLFELICDRLEIVTCNFFCTVR